MLLPKTWIICRVCLKQQEILFNIFDDKVVKSIWSILRDCGGVPVRRNDDFPDKICEPCLGRLCEANTFRTDCQRGHRDLVQMLAERNFKMYEMDLEEETKYCADVISISDTTMDYPASSCITKLEPQMSIKQSEFSENLADTANGKNTIENEITTHNMKQYRVISKNNNEEQIIETTAKTNRREPIVLLLKLKNITHVENTLKTNTTDPSTKVTKKLQTKKKTATKSTNKTDTKKIVNKRMKLKTETELILKTKLKSKSTKKYDTGKAIFKCKVCKKKFNSYNHLRHHMYTHDRPHQCKICKKTFSQIQTLACHENLHTGKKPYNCRFCNKKYSDISNRNKHERKLHKNNGFKCETCNKIFRLQSILRKHAQSHRAKKCFICNREFSSLQMVRIHHQRQHLKLLNKQ